MVKMTKEEFLKNIEYLGINYNNDMINKLDIYLEFLKEYNEHTNLTAITSDEDIYLKHFYDSLTFNYVYNLTNESILDIGSGAGFPGIVLKIFFPNIKITLIDSNNKKTQFLKLLQEKLAIDGEVINDRVENYAKNNLNKFDIVTSRAVANLRVLSELSLPLVKENGLFIALKGQIDENYENALDTIEVLNAKIIKTYKFNLPNESGIRNIIVIKKEKNTAKEILRPYDKILKKPLKKINK